MARFTMVALAGLAMIAAACNDAGEPQEASWPPEYVAPANDDVEIRFAYPGTNADWRSSAFIRHVPSSSILGVNPEGRVTLERINGAAGQAAVCAVLSDESLLSGIRLRVAELDVSAFGQRLVERPACESAGPPPVRPTIEPGGVVNLQYPPWPADFKDYRLVVDEEIEVRYSPPSPNADYHSAFTIGHVPSSSYVQLNRSGVPTHAEINSSDARSALCAVLTNEGLMDRLTSRAAEITGAFIFPHSPLLPGPCEGPVPIATSTPPPLTREELSEFFRRNALKVEVWPRGYNLQVNEELEVRFSYPAQLADWIASAFIRHDPSGSSLGLNQDGFVTHNGVNGVEATVAICEVLNDRELMGSITARASEINAYTFGQRPLDNLPCESLESSLDLSSPARGDGEDDEQLRIVYDRRDWPTDYRLEVSDEVEVQFAYPADGVTWASPIFVWHKSSGTVSVDLDGRVDFVESGVGPEAVAATCSILADETLIGEVISQATEIGAARIYSRPFEPDPCDTPQ